MPDSIAYAAYDQLCCDFEDNWDGPSVERIQEAVNQAKRFSLDRRELLGELLAMEFEFISQHEQTLERETYESGFPNDQDIVEEAIDKWVCRALEARLHEGSEARIEDWAEILQLERAPTRAKKLLIEEHRLRKMYHCATREYDYARDYPELWPDVKKELLLLGLLEDEQTLVRFEIVTGPHAGETFEFSEHDSIVIGRGSRCGMQLSDDPYFSRHHLRIEIKPPLCHLIDLKSRNGTFVNAQQVQEAYLRNGDQVSGGQTLLRIKIEGQPIDQADSQNEPVRQNPPSLSALDNRPVNSHMHSTSIKPQTAEGTLAGSQLATNGISAQQLFEALNLDNLQQLGAYQVASESRATQDREANPRQAETSFSDSSSAPTSELRDLQILSVWRDQPTRKTYLAATANGQQLVIKATQTSSANESNPMPFTDPENPYQRFRHPLYNHSIQTSSQLGWYFRIEPFVEQVSVGKELLSMSKDDGLRLAIDLVCSAADVLSEAHQRGLIHGNLHPGNLLVHHVNSELSVKLNDLGEDFNLQRAKQLPLSQTEGIDGANRHSFMAPERILEYRHASQEGDQYSLASILYFYLAGHSPVPLLDTSNSIASVLNGTIPPINQTCDWLPTSLADVIDRAMFQQPERRYASVAEFSQRLSRQAETCL